MTSTDRDIMREALEAIIEIEEDSPAAFKAAKLIAQETLDSTQDRQNHED